MPCCLAQITVKGRWGWEEQPLESQYNLGMYSRWKFAGENRDPTVAVSYNRTAKLRDTAIGCPLAELASGHLPYDGTDITRRGYQHACFTQVQSRLGQLAKCTGMLAGHVAERSFPS